MIIVLNIQWCYVIHTFHYRAKCIHGICYYLVNFSWQIDGKKLPLVVHNLVKTGLNYMQSIAWMYVRLQLVLLPTLCLSGSYFFFLFMLNRITSIFLLSIIWIHVCFSYLTLKLSAKNSVEISIASNFKGDWVSMNQMHGTIISNIKCCRCCVFNKVANIVLIKKINGRRIPKLNHTSSIAHMKLW